MNSCSVNAQKRCIKPYFTEARIVSNEYAAAGCYCLTVKLSRAVSEQNIPCAGQFYMLGLKDTGHILPRPLSLHSFDCAKDSLTFVYKVSGDGTAELSQYRCGESIHIQGPLGNGFVIMRRTRLHLVAGGGIGIAPLHRLVQDIARKSPAAQIVFLVGGKNAEIGSFAAFLHLPAFVRTLFCTDDGSLGIRGFVPDLLKDYIEKNDLQGSKDTMIYACGPNSMLEKIVCFAVGSDIPCQISLERRMACGVHACMGCSVKTVNGIQKVCSDGPVFDARLFAGLGGIV